MKPIAILAALVAVLIFGACNTPGPAFRGTAPTRLTLGGATFDVRVKGTRAQAMRLDTRWAPRLSTVAPHGVAAIERVSGCRVRWLDGDAALMTAWLDCGQPLEPLPRGHTYDCDIYSIAKGLAELNCVEVRY